MPPIRLWITNRAYGIALMVSINMLLLIVCAGEVAEFTRERDKKRKVFEGELTWWDMEVRRLDVSSSFRTNIRRGLTDFRT